MMHDENDQEEFWHFAGRALGFIVTIVGALSLITMAVALILLAV